MVLNEYRHGELYSSVNLKLPCLPLLHVHLTRRFENRSVTRITVQIGSVSHSIGRNNPEDHGHYVNLIIAAIYPESELGCGILADYDFIKTVLYYI